MTSLTSYDTVLSSGSVTPPTLVPFQQIEAVLISLLSSPETLESTIMRSQAMAFRLASNSAAATVPTCSSLPIQTIGQPPNPPLSLPTAQMCIKTGYAAGDTKIVSKVAAGGGNAPNTGCVMVYSQETLRLEHILCDEGLLTEVRTAAAGAFVTRSIIMRAGGPDKIRKVGLVGGGVQAIWQLRLLYACGAVNPSTTKVVVKTTSKRSAEEFVKKMKTSTYSLDRTIEFEFFDEIQRFKDCQVVYTLTPSRQVVLEKEDMTFPIKEDQPLLHITAVGSDSPGKCEVSTELLAELADVCLVDLTDQSHERGEFQSSRWDSKSICPEVVEVGNTMNEDYIMQIPKESGKFTIFDSSGLAMQDVQMAKLVCEELK